jgi:hypothetical protein
MEGHFPEGEVEASGYASDIEFIELEGSISENSLRVLEETREHITIRIDIYAEIEFEVELEFSNYHSGHKEYVVLETESRNFSCQETLPVIMNIVQSNKMSEPDFKITGIALPPFYQIHLGEIDLPPSFYYDE